MFRKVSEFTELSNIICPYIATQFISLDTCKLIQVNMTTFIRVIQEPKSKDADNILIIQGGIRHSSKQSYYLKWSSSYYPPNLRIFVFEKFDPLINFNSTDDLQDTFKYIRKNYSGKLITIGFSMGGLLLSAYLAKTQQIKEDPSLFITCCNSFDVPNFREILKTNALFAWIQQRDLTAFGVKTYEELKARYKIPEEQEEYMNCLFEKMNDNVKRWKDKLIWVLGEKDPLTLNYRSQLKQFKRAPFTICCYGGWHCCSYCIRTTIEIASDFFDSDCTLKEFIQQRKSDERTKR